MTEIDSIVPVSADQADPSIRAGLRGESDKFWAREGGHELGTPFEREVGR